MSGRQYSTGGGYRYGFNGKEKDSDIAADNYDFGARIYDARIGRWMAVDPLFRKYTSYSVYSTVFNCPLIFIDHDGREIIKPVTTISYTGPSVPTCLGDVAHTNPTIDFKLNESTKAIDFIIITEIIYSSSFEEIVKVNGENFRGFVQKHEDEHIARNHQAADEAYTFEAFFNDKNICIVGTLDVIATKIYSEEVLPMVDKLKKEKYKLMDDALLEFDELTKDMDVDSKEYASARTNLRNKKDQISLDYDAKESELLNSFYKNILGKLMTLYEERDKVLQDHYGPEGVIQSALNKMTSEEAKYNDKPIYDQNKNEIQNCPENEH